MGLGGTSGLGPVWGMQVSKYSKERGERHMVFVIAEEGIIGGHTGGENPWLYDK